MNYTPNQQTSVAFCLHAKAKFSNLETFLNFFDHLSDSIVYFEAEETSSIESRPNDLWQIDIYLDKRPHMERIQQQLDQLTNENNIEKTILTISEVEQLDWAKEVQKTFKPIKAGKFFIHPSDYSEELSQDLINIKIDAGSAFGTGEHETTSNCLKALTKFGQGQKALDMGCGSGILAIAMAKLGIDLVVAVDIDEQAIEVTKQNSKINQVNISFIGKSDGYNSESVRNNSPYDVICANILAGPLVAMAESAVKSLNKQGILILAGFLPDQLDDVITTHQNKGLKLVEIITEKTWPAIILQNAR